MVINGQIPSSVREFGVGQVFLQQSAQIIMKLPALKPITIGMSLALQLPYTHILSAYEEHHEAKFPP